MSLDSRNERVAIVRHGRVFEKYVFREGVLSTWELRAGEARADAIRLKFIYQEGGNVAVYNHGNGDLVFELKKTTERDYSLRLHLPAEGIIAYFKQGVSLFRECPHIDAASLVSALHLERDRNREEMIEYQYQCDCVSSDLEEALGRSIEMFGLSRSQHKLPKAVSLSQEQRSFTGSDLVDRKFFSCTWSCETGLPVSRNGNLYYAWASDGYEEQRSGRLGLLRATNEVLGLEFLPQIGRTGKGVMPMNWDTKSTRL